MNVPTLFSSNVVRINDIDPTNITAENKFIIESLFSDNYLDEIIDKRVLTVEVKDELNDNYAVYKVGFKYPLIVRRDFYGRLVVDVVGDSMGEGGFGCAKAIIGSLKHRLGELYFEEGENRRIIKTSNSVHYKYDKEYIDAARNEFNLTSACKHTNARGFFTNKPKLQNDTFEFAFSMRRFCGSNLFEVLEKDKDKIEELSILDRFQLTMAVLERLEYQVHFNRVVHRDIKPENIMVFKAGKHWVANYIDFNLSRWIDKIDSNIVGTLFYLSPDYLTSNLDEKSDLYSAILNILSIWRDKEQIKIEDMDDPVWIRNAYHWNVPLDLFKDIKGIPRQIQNGLKNVINQCLSYKKGSRPDLRSAIDKFAEVYLSYKLLTIPAESHAAVKTAHRLGYETKYQLRSIVGQGMYPASVKTLQSDLLRALDTLPDDEYAVKEFAECFGVLGFANATNKNTLLDIVSKTANVFSDQFMILQEHRNQLLEIYGALVSKKNLTGAESGCIKILTEQIRYAEKIPEKLAKKPLELDELIDQASRMIFKNQKITRAILHVEKMLQPAAEVSVMNNRYVNASR